MKDDRQAIQAISMPANDRPPAGRGTGGRTKKAADQITKIGASRNVLIGIIGLLLASLAALALWKDDLSVATVPRDELQKLTTCRADVLGLIKPTAVDIGLLEKVGTYCYVQVSNADTLGDFDIRRSDFLRQQFEGRVILWMVIAITLSGVVLAGLQLLAGYHLAVAGRGAMAQDQEIVLEQKRISLKSSVTGLLVLVVSFAFFIVYVAWVFTIREVSTSPRPQSPSAAAGRTFLPDMGGLGAAEPEAQKPPAQ